ncbi:MAG: hypothetical protein CM15mP40_11900 [Alphaproteobacteria bacterium]|nr:MAG: hypothetical protein CM15mP40_11900 [Alphaproteobacteria bacterium]
MNFNINFLNTDLSPFVLSTSLMGYQPFYSNQKFESWIDFKGGIMIEAKFSVSDLSLLRIKSKLANWENFEIQEFGDSNTILLDLKK